MLYPTYTRRSDPYSLMRSMLRDFDRYTPTRASQAVFPAVNVWQGDDAVTVRGDTAWITLPFPWVLGDAHHVTIVTRTGATFEHEIPVAVPTPVVTAGSLQNQALLGLFVGILPVSVGLMFYPALRGAGPASES